MLKKIKLSLFSVFFLIAANTAFASVCLKNDTHGVGIMVLINDGNGNPKWSRTFTEGNIFVSAYNTKRIIIKQFGADYENTFDNFGSELEDGDMVHVGGWLHNLYVSWVEKGNCNGRNAIESAWE